MAMLADRKQKQRWSLNPRGKAWSEDSNKFGQRMLEKMGWAEGKGLGAKEDGIKQQVKVSYKNDSKGMGFKEIEQWTEHEENFTELLKTLTAECDVKRPDNEKPPSSLEEMSQRSRVRVHYHKYTRGKDLSKYSEKDLANIFGKKSLAPPNEVFKDESQIHGGSMAEYFQKKLPDFALNNDGYFVGNNGVLQKERSRKRKFTETEEGIDNPLFQQRNDESIAELSERNPYEVKVKRKKKKKNVKDSEQGIDNPLFQQTIAELAESNPYEVKVKRKKKKNTETVESIVNEERLENGIDNPLFQHRNDESFAELAESNPNEVKVKRKKKKNAETVESVVSEERLENGIDNPLFQHRNDESFADLAESNPYEVTVKRKKKKDVVESGIDNPLFEQRNDESIAENNPYEVKNKRKKKKKTETVESVEIDTELADGTSCEVKSKRKKKKRDVRVEASIDPYEVKREKKSKVDVLGPDNPSSLEIDGADNPSLQVVDEIQIDDDLLLNVVSLPAVEPKKKEKPPPRKSLKGRKSVTFSDVTEERIIPNNQDNRLYSTDDITKRNELFEINSKVIRNGLDNACFNRRSNDIQENIDSMTKAIDMYQAEVENDINEAKINSRSESVGELGDPCDQNVRLEDGTKLSFKHAAFGRMPTWMRRKDNGASKSKAPYRHLIRGDIILKFNSTNLHEIVGYATKTRKTKL